MMMHSDFWGLHTHSLESFKRKRGSDHLCKCNSGLLIAVSVHRVRDMGVIFLETKFYRHISSARA